MLLPQLSIESYASCNMLHKNIRCRSCAVVPSYATDNFVGIFLKKAQW